MLFNTTSHEKSRGFVYRWTHTPTGEYYIGIHKGTPCDGYMGSGKLFRQRFNETYGIDWNREILLEGDYYTDCSALEAELVTNETIEDPLCLNRNLGGSNGPRIKDRINYTRSTTKTKSRPYRVKPQTVYVRGKVYNTRMDAVRALDISFEELDEMLVESGWDNNTTYNGINAW